MPRPRTPTHILEARGSFIHNPDRRRIDPETTDGLGDPPAHLDELNAAMWNEVSSILPVDVAKNADRLAVEILCDLMVRFRKRAINGAELGQLVKLLSQMGMTPADRSKVGVSPDKKKDANPFAAFTMQ